MTAQSQTKNIIVGISGASGVIYAQRLIAQITAAQANAHVVVSNPGREILAHELGIDDICAGNLIGHESKHFIPHDNQNLFSELASGSVPIDAMIICPCSSNSLAAIASGLADNLLRRAAYVTLKQKRPLILVHRETPLTSIDLENMLRLSRAGATICPASPGFYHHPQTIEQLADSLVGRVLDMVGIEHDLPVRWSDPKG
ncbi:MAG: UbiX family flavin prenyltransferase [Sedimentisphaerales bacterium]|nr:UbiX family flavin prenyltransferase [Sedimentisphaerales bacterium]